jgi:hypothetical protein
MVVMERKRRLWWVWVLGAIVGVAMIAAVAAAMNRGPYAFLDRFHPKRRVVDLNKYMQQMGAVSPSPKPAELPTFEIYEFNASDSEAVLNALKSELGRRGFTATDTLGSMPASVKKDPEYARSRLWQFMDMRAGAAMAAAGSAGPSNLDFEMAMYASGPMAEAYAHMYDTPPSRLASPFNPASKPSYNGCVVMAMHRESWMEEKIRALREFFHL